MPFTNGRSRQNRRNVMSRVSQEGLPLRGRLVLPLLVLSNHEAMAQTGIHKQTWIRGTTTAPAIPTPMIGDVRKEVDSLKLAIGHQGVQLHRAIRPCLRMLRNLLRRRRRQNPNDSDGNRTLARPYPQKAEPSRRLPLRHRGR